MKCAPVIYTAVGSALVAGPDEGPRVCPAVAPTIQRGLNAKSPEVGSAPERILRAEITSRTNDTVDRVCTIGQCRISTRSTVIKNTADSRTLIITGCYRHILSFQFYFYFN